MAGKFIAAFTAYETRNKGGGELPKSCTNHKKNSKRKSILAAVGREEAYGKIRETQKDGSSKVSRTSLLGFNAEACHFVLQGGEI